MSLFAAINTNYDDSVPLAKPGWRWWDKANCKDVPESERSRIFFPAKKHQVLAVAYAEAHEYCKDCPVRVQCRESAINEEGRRAYGYRGDMDHHARRAIHYDRKHKGLINKHQRADDGLNLRRKNR